MESMASFHCSHLCLSRWDSSAAAALLNNSSVGGIQEGVIKTLTFLIPTWYVVVSATMWDGSLGRFDYGTTKLLISLLNIGGEDVKLCVTSLVRRCSDSSQPYRFFIASMAYSVLSFPAHAKAKSGLVPLFQCSKVKLAAPFELWSSIKLLLAAHSTKHSLLDVFALYPHCTCWQLKSLAYTHAWGWERWK